MVETVVLALADPGVAAQGAAGSPEAVLAVEIGAAAVALELVAVVRTTCGCIWQLRMRSLIGQ